MEIAVSDPGFAGTSSPIELHGFDAAEENEGILVRLVRRKLLFLSVFASVLAVVAGVYLYLPPIYKAETIVAISVPDQLLDTQQSGIAQVQSIGDSADLESQSAFLTSPMLLREVLAKPKIQAALLAECELLAPPAWKATLKQWLHLKPARPCADQLEDTAGLVSTLQSRSNVASVGRSRDLSVSYSSPSPEVAKAVTDGIVGAYLDDRLRDKLQPRENAIRWLNEEVKRIGDRLNDTELQIETFLHQKGVVRGQVAGIASEQLTEVAQQLGAAKADQATAAGRMQQAQIPNNATSSILGNRTVGDVKQQLASIVAKIAQLSDRYGPANPALSELLEQRRMLEQMLSQESSLVNRSAAADYEAASSRVAALEKQMESLKRDVRGNDDAATQVAALERQMNSDRELYVDLTKNLNQLQTSLRLVTPNAQLVNWAELPRSVFFPKISMFALTGMLLAFGSAAAAALLRDRADRTLRTPAGLQMAANLRVLSRIPHLPHSSRSALRLVAQIQRPSAFQEAIRALYAECLLVNGPTGKSKTLRKLLITSSDCGEGKSFTALSFALFAAATGLHVLLLECDLRRPSIGRSLSLPMGPGVTDILRGHATPTEAVRHPIAMGPDILVAGKAAVESAELLAGQRMEQLMLWASEKYDLVIIDTPPSRILPDARILAPSVDGVLCCAQWGHSLTESVIQGAREITAAGGRVLGVVLDRVLERQYSLYSPHDRKMVAYLPVQDR